MPFHNIVSRTDASALIPDEVVDEVIQAETMQRGVLSPFPPRDDGHQTLHAARAVRPSPGLPIDHAGGGIAALKPPV